MKSDKWSEAKTDTASEGMSESWRVFIARVIGSWVKEKRSRLTTKIDSLSTRTYILIVRSGSAVKQSRSLINKLITWLPAIEILFAAEFGCSSSIQLVLSKERTRKKKKEQEVESHVEISEKNS